MGIGEAQATKSIKTKPISSGKDYLWLNISSLPYFRGLLRAVEARFYQDLPLESPILDVGCGDGHFASVAFDYPLTVGIDPWQEPIQQARRWNAYQALVQGEASRIPFPQAFFSSAISNSVLEHIPDIQSVMNEIGRVLQPGGLFVFCVPNHQFLASLSIGQFLDHLNLKGWGQAYRRFFNHIARHHHCDPPAVWLSRLERAGFTLEQYWHYYPPRAMQISEWGHFWGTPALITRQLTGKWVIFPSRKNPFLNLLDRYLRKVYEQDPVCEDGVCTFYITRRNP
jgi:SAM-dependent methyltransferase